MSLLQSEEYIYQECVHLRAINVKVRSDLAEGMPLSYWVMNAAQPNGAVLS